MNIYMKSVAESQVDAMDLLGAALDNESINKASAGQKLVVN